jgi:hypothetical protein
MTESQGLFQLRPTSYFVPTVTFWINPLNGYAEQLEFPRTEAFKRHMQHAHFEKVCILIEEDMRKKREQRQIAKFFNAPFIEDTPVPYLGFKRLNIRGVTVSRQLSDPRFESGWDGSVWETASREAECNIHANALFSPNEVPHHPEYIPYPKCSCGIYTYNREYIWALKLGDDNSRRFGGPDSWTRVTPYPSFYEACNVVLSLGGYVQRYTQGYRSSIAKIEAIVTDPLTTTGLFASKSMPVHPNSPNYKTVNYEQLAMYYRVPVITPDNIPDFMAEYEDRWRSG